MSRFLSRPTSEDVITDPFNNWRSPIAWPVRREASLAGRGRGLRAAGWAPMSYLPSGEISDSHDGRLWPRRRPMTGRPLVVLTFSDFDPERPADADHHRPEVAGVPGPGVPRSELSGCSGIGLTAAQVRAFDLPSTPLKETERRADKWRDAFGIEQTEIDALLALRPDAPQAHPRRLRRPSTTVARRPGRGPTRLASRRPGGARRPDRSRSTWTLHRRGSQRSARPDPGRDREALAAQIRIDPPALFCPNRCPCRSRTSGRDGGLPSLDFDLRLCRPDRG